MSGFESPSGGGKRERLDEDDAHELANMMQAKLEMNPRTGNIPTNEQERRLSGLPAWEGGRAPTANDYDAALAAIEDLKASAAEETVYKKAGDAFARLMADSASAAWLFASVIRAIAENSPTSDNRAEVDRRIGERVAAGEGVINAWRERFENASYQLRKLRDEAKKNNA